MSICGLLRSDCGGANGSNINIDAVSPYTVRAINTNSGGYTDNFCVECRVTPNDGSTDITL